MSLGTVRSTCAPSSPSDDLQCPEGYEIEPAEHQASLGSNFGKKLWPFRCHRCLQASPRLPNCPHIACSARHAAMLDINNFRTGVAACERCGACRQSCRHRSHPCFPDAERGGDPEVVRESQRRRFADVGLVDSVLALDAQWRDGEAVGESMGAQGGRHAAAGCGAGAVQGGGGGWRVAAALPPVLAVAG